MRLHAGQILRGIAQPRWLTRPGSDKHNLHRYIIIGSYRAQSV